ncbi:MAG TPA: HDIG domain-containing protein [Candidatus Marinimicrobia bacterium]|nr:HDIG domain-containing protein [Candidatus Neomarinimicrobiota bacterium]
MIRNNRSEHAISDQLISLSQFWIQYLIIFGLILVISLLFPRGQSLQYSYQLNDISRDPIIAPFTFSILKTDERYKQDLDERIKSVPYVFNRDEKIVEMQINALDAFFATVNELRYAMWRFNESKQLVFERKYHPSGEKAQSEYIADSTNLSILTSEFNKIYPFTALKDSSWKKYLSSEQNPRNLKDWSIHKELVQQICRNRWAEGIYDIPIDSIISIQVTVNQEEVPILAVPSAFNSLESAWTKAREEFLGQSTDENGFKDLGYDLIVEFMKPNLLFDNAVTESKQQESLSKVPRSKGVVLEDELIVDANIRITQDVLQKLKSLATAVEEKDVGGRLMWVWNYIGRVILLSVVVSFFFTFLLVYRVAIFRDWKMVFLIVLVFLLQIGLAYIIVIRLEWSEYLIPVTVGAMTLTILFDARIGFMATVVMAILMGLMMGQNIDFVIVSLFTSTIAVYNIRELRKRSQLFITMFALMGASIIVVIALGLFKEHTWGNMFFDLQLLAINSFLAPIITYGLIGLFEIAFEITTNLTLIELLDYDHPLLKRSQQEINGTFNHSVVVGNLAEACAGAIGAHSLLCRVGAYYHDIGKMVKPDYFIENQFAGENMHDTLKSTMSARIIRNHVHDGLHLANEYGLPKIVSDFIPMHHGTTRVEYFYRKAIEEAGGEKSKVDESQFRYPGPKPNTRETGILMICEAIEAAVRSIKNPDIMKIEAMIDKIIKQRIDDHQLDECPLTLDELRKIKGTVDGNTGLLPVLRGIYHIRIEYPDDNHTLGQTVSSE